MATEDSKGVKILVAEREVLLVAPLLALRAAATRRSPCARLARFGRRTRLIGSIEGSNRSLIYSKGGLEAPFAIDGGERGIRTLDGVFSPILP